jgi:hypothetical protein
MSDSLIWSFLPRIVAAAHENDGRSAAAIGQESMTSAMERIFTTFAADGA